MISKRMVHFLYTRSMICNNPERQKLTRDPLRPKCLTNSPGSSWKQRTASLIEMSRGNQTPHYLTRRRLAKLVALSFFGVFVSLEFFFLGISLLFLNIFCLFYRFLRVRTVRKILGVLRFSLVFSKRTRKGRPG